MLKQKNSKRQANVGIGVAISHFATKGYTVCIPLTDSQDYDLVIETEDNAFKKVQVKTVYFKSRYGKYIVELRTRTHSQGKLYSSKSLGDMVDYVFVLTEEGKKYLIPRKDIKTKTGLCLNKKFDSYIV